MTTSYDSDEDDVREFASFSNDGCLKTILAFIIAVLLTAVLLWTVACKSYKQPKTSWLKKTDLTDSGYTI